MALPLNPLAQSDVPDIWKYLNTSENTDLYAQLAQAAQQAGMAGVTQQLPAKPWPPNGPMLANTNGPIGPLALAQRAREMFLKRMGGIRAELRVAEGDYLHCHVYGEMVFVFYCFSGKPGVTQESIDLFPSDMLITQFRMILS